MSTLKTLLAACAASLALTAPLAAGDTVAIQITDPYARSSSPAAKSGAVFMVISNEADSADRLVAAASPVAQRVELHTHIEDANGVMRMIEVEDGFALPSGADYMLERGGDHVMLMGLTESLVDGENIALTLVFENAGEVEIEVPVDLTRKPAHGGHNH